jgi:uncharacterized protein YggL (DUF469 family)
MKKRLRKKRRVGEFREDVFPIRFRFESGLSVGDRNQLLDDWIKGAVEANGLAFGGGGCGSVWSGLVQIEGRGSATAAHQRIVGHWLAHHPRVLAYAIGPLEDGWHGPFIDPDTLVLGSPNKALQTDRASLGG